MLIFPCHVCKTSLSADDSQIGQLVRCPTCLAPLRVPAQSQVPQPAPAAAPKSPATSQAPPMQRVRVPPHLIGRVGPGKRYGFSCVYCSSRLEANEAMGGSEGQCPTCGNNIIIPILDRFGRLIDPITRQIIKQDPHPVHAYAAAGDRAPRIVRMNDDSQVIECPRCQTVSPVSANNCRACGMPFTMEGTTLEASGTSNSFCVASLVLGIMGLPASCVVVPSLLAIIFGVVGYRQVSQSGESSGRGMAIAGMICGGIGSLLAFWMYVLN